MVNGRNHSIHWEWGGPFCEGNAWHYTWSVFHDVQGLIDLFGSDEKFTTKIDSVFTIPNIIKPGTYGGVIHEMKEMELANMGQYAHEINRSTHALFVLLCRSAVENSILGTSDC